MEALGLTQFELACCLIGYALGFVQAMSIFSRRREAARIEHKQQKTHTTEWPDHPCKNCGAIKRIVTSNEERGGYDRRCAFCGEDNDWLPSPCQTVVC